jgi:hypothetical protein
VCKRLLIVPLNSDAPHTYTYVEQQQYYGPAPPPPLITQQIIEPLHYQQQQVPMAPNPYMYNNGPVGNLIDVAETAVIGSTFSPYRNNAMSSAPGFATRFVEGFAADKLAKRDQKNFKKEMKRERKEMKKYGGAVMTPALVPVQPQVYGGMQLPLYPQQQPFYSQQQVFYGRR